MKRRSGVSQKGALYKLAAFIVFVILVVSLSYLGGLREYLDIEKIRFFVEKYEPWSPILFSFGFLVIIFFFIPPTLMTIAAGFLFGSLYGMVISLICVNFSALVLFIISRRLARDGVQAVMGHKMKKLDGKLRENGLGAVIVLRLIFTPFGLVCISAGFSSIRLWDFMLGTLVGTFPAVAGLSFMGEVLLEVMDSGDISLLMRSENVFFVLLLALVILFPFVYNKISRKTKDIEQKYD